MFGTSGTPGTQHPSTPGGTSGFLPGFLLGTPDTKRSPRPSERPPAAGSVSWADGTPTTPGPPTRSLYSEPLSSSGVQDSWCLSPKPTYSTLATSPKYTSILQESNSLNVSGRQDSTLFSPEEKSSAESGETWVTVFGFPPSSSSYMLQQFSQYGTIVKYKVSSEGNWMDLCYQSRLQAQKALSKNGKIFGQNTMVGVKPCDRAPHHHQATPGASELAKENTTVAGARPLVQAYRASASGRQVTLPETPTPQRDDSVVSRALEYVFGW
ncbi:nucleoporin NUP35-like isoform X2 [Haemaphysalis longicornis]